MYGYEQHKVQIYDLNTLFEEQVSIEVLKQYHDKYCNLTAKDLDKWRSISRSIYQITHLSEKSTHVQMKNIIEFYTLLNQNNRLYEDGRNRWREVYLSDDKVFDFFMNQFFYECAKYLIDEKTFHYDETLELSNCILLQSVYLFLTTFEKTTIPVIEMLAYIFDHKKQYFQANNKLNSTFHVQQLFGMREDIREWLQNLEVGQIVDAIKVDKSHGKHCWSRAEITNIQDDHVFLRFLNASKQFNRSVYREGFDIREKGTRCPDEEIEWRMLLKEGSLIDCCDTSHVFYNSTVLQVREIEDEQGHTIKQAFVAYRIYEQNGTKKDEKGGKFNGWSSQYDEWLDVTHPRIAKYQSQAKKLYTKASTSNQDEHIDDFNDLVQILEDQNEIVYASPKRTQCQSLFLMAAINKFGRKGGFDLILNKIEGQGDEWCPIDHLASFMHALGNVQNCLNRYFAQPYANRVILAVQRNILESPASNLRNFTKEKIDLINQGLGSFMKRIYSIGQKIEMLEKFNLQMALQSFNSEFIKTQLQGLKTIMELLSQLKNDRTAESLQSSELRDWIEENQIFQKLFNCSKYQLIQKAGDFFKFMLNEGMIKEEHLEILWNQTRKNDKELKLAIYKILTDTYYTPSFDKTIIEFFLNKIIQSDPQEIGNEDIDLIHMFTRFSSSSKGRELQDSVRQFYWKLIENSYELPLDLVEETIKSFCESYSIDNNRVTIQSVLEKCIDHINTGSYSTLYVLKIIQKIVEGLYTTQNYVDTIIKKDAVSFLFTEKNIVHVLVNNIRQIKKDILQKIADNQGTVDKSTLTESVLDSYIARNTFIEHIQSRIDFLSFIYINLPNEIELTLEVISEVWDAVIVEGLIPREKDIIYKWFSELNTNNMNQSSQLIKKEDLDIFFHTKLCNEEDLRLMTSEGLNCFKSIFCILNEKDGKMQKFPLVKMFNNNILYNQINYSNYNNQNDNRTNPDFEYSMIDLPTNLKGIDSLWLLITLNQNQEVIAKALEFLNNLHTNFDSSVSESEDVIKRRYYQQAYEYLQKQTEEGGDSERVKRCIMIMESILDESEKKGNGGLKSLMSLSKGELITLQFSTTFYNSDIPNNFSFKMYSNDSVMDLLYKVGLYIKCTYEEVGLSIAEPKREIEAKENGKSIAELRLKNGEKLLVSQRKGSPVKEEELIINGEINSMAIVIFKRWFAQFQIDNIMKPQQVAQFINSCTNDNCQETDSRVVGCMEQYDKGKKGYLNEENFIEFYSTACRSKQDVVRKNLVTHGYRKDLKRYDEVTIESIDVTSMPRYILARDEKFFKMIFDLLDRKDVANVTWRFLSRLPISPVLYEKIVKLNGIRDQKEPNWETVLGGESMYKLLYNLHVIEYLMEEEGETATQSTNKIISDESEELKQFKKNWRSDFIKLGGFDHLFKRFNSLLLCKDILVMDTFQKYILSFILKIFKNYIVAAFACTESHIYKTVTRMSLTHVPLPALILSIREDIRNNRLTIRRKESEYRESLIEQELKRMEIMDDQHKSSNQNDNKKSTYDVKVEESEEFLQLLSNLQSQGLSKQILQKFDFQSFLNQLCKLCMGFITFDSELESEDRVIVEFSLLIISAILVQDKSLSDSFFSEKSEFTKLLSAGLFYKGNQNIRKIFNHCFFMIALSHLQNNNNENPIQRLMSILMINIPGLHNDNQNCTQYFELFCGLLDSLAYHQIDTSVSYDWLDFPTLLQTLVNSLKNHESTETRTQTKNDKILIGLLNLCDRILCFKEELKIEVGSTEGCDLVKEIFHKCLFDLSDHQQIGNDEIKRYDKLVVKCKGDQSRVAAFKLLLTLCKNCPSNIQILMENGLQQLIEMLPSNSGFSLSYMRESKSDYGYVGVKNLGCICYMIAMLQQFFMTPTFRYAVLMANDDEPENIVDAVYNKKKIVTDDNLLHQFQQMFSFLEMSDRMDYNPIEFCYSFKDYGGDPVNTVIQQDAQEFLNMIFDKLENGLKKTPFKKILEKVYGGKTCSQLICSNCKQITNRFEQFYNLSVEVKNFKSLTESLDKFIAGENISDFKCEACEKKVDVRKRVCLSELPNVLIVHLQRIIFDLESLQNIKVNSRLEFPETLDLEPYTKEGLEARESENGQPINKDKYEYKLAGVVVHTGTAEYGHYYSYIDSSRDRENLTQPMKESWLEFNDSRVRDFSIKSLENECFGGHNSDWDDNSFNFGWFRNRDNSKNAYILVYEKIIKDPVELVFDNQLQMERIIQKIPINNYKIVPHEVKEGDEQLQPPQIRLMVDYYDIQPYVPDNHFKKVWMDNHQFMFERHIYNENFYQFIKEITNSIDLPVLTDEDCPNGYYKDYDKYTPQMRESFYQLMQTHVKIILDLLNKSLGSQMIDEMITRLRILLKLCPDHCANFFMNNFLKDFESKEGAIIKSSDSSMRNFLSKMYADCTQIIISYHNLNLTAEGDKQYEEEQENSDDELDENSNEAKKNIQRNYFIRKTIINFLGSLYSYLQEFAFKNPFKTESYFMFWDAFSLQGIEQMKFLIEQKICLGLLDFFMGNDSPLQSRMDQMNSRQISPRYTYLIKCVANILEQGYRNEIFIEESKINKKEITTEFDSNKGQGRYYLSNDIKLFIFNEQFWDKLISNDTVESQVKKQIIEKVAKNHQFVSDLVSGAIVRVRIGIEEVKMYAQDIYNYLSIQDNLRGNRIEAILGVPMLVQNYPIHLQNSDKIYEPLSVTVHYGTYALSNIDEQSLCMKSSLQFDNSNSMLEAIYTNRKSSDCVSVSLLVSLLQLGIEQDDIAEYLALLPSPSYAFAKYVDFIEHFIREFHNNSQYQKYSIFPRVEYAQNCLRLYPQFKQKIDAVYARLNIQFITPEQEVKSTNASPNKDSVDGEQEDNNDQEKNIKSSEKNGNNQYNIVVQEIDKTEINYQNNTQDCFAYQQNDTTSNNSNNNNNNINLNMHPLYTIGKTREVKLIKEAQFPLAENFLHKYTIFEYKMKVEKVKNEEELNELVKEMNQLKQESSHTDEYLSLYEREVNTYITDNQPTQNGNKAYDSSIVKDCFIMTGCLSATSPWNGFFKNRQSSYYQQSQYNQIDYQEQNRIIESNFSNADTIREIVAINKTMHQIEVKLEFILHEPENPNQKLFPTFAKYLRIKPKSNEVIYSIPKQNLSYDWGHYEINVSYTIFQSSDEDCFKYPLSYQIRDYTHEYSMSSIVNRIKSKEDLSWPDLVTCIGFINNRQLSPIQYESNSGDQLDENQNEEDENINNNNNNIDKLNIEEI